MKEKYYGLCRPAMYRITVADHLDEGRRAWFGDLLIENMYDQEGNAITTFSGIIADQSMLYGTLEKLRNLGMTLVSLERSNIEEEADVRRQE